MKNRFEIITTINTKNITNKRLQRFIANGATIFRINGAFLEIDEVASIIDRIREEVGSLVKILIDLPGYKLRFLNLRREIEFRAEVPFELKDYYFNYPAFFDYIDEGSVIRINDGFNKLVISEKKSNSIICISDSNGTIKRGKGLHIHGITFRSSSTSLTAYDLDLIEAIKGYEVDFVGLSFVHNMDDVRHVQSKLAPSSIKCIPKIESKESIRNLYDILNNSELVILDRGDLAGEIGLESIWKIQRQILALSKPLNCKVIIATQVVASMIRNPLPSIAEVNAIYDLLALGIDGVQFSEETSVGQYSEECIKFISGVANDFNRQSNPRPLREGGVIWLYGKTGSGKTSIAKRIVKKTAEKRLKLAHFDGDEVRDMFGANHGFSASDRLQVVKNLVDLANKFADQGISVIVSALTAHENAREYVRENARNLVTIFIECSLNECERRDPKGLYTKARQGLIDTLIGYNSPYPVPDNVDLFIDTEKKSIDASADVIINFLAKEYGSLLLDSI